MKKLMIGLVLGWVCFQVNAEELKWTTDLNAAKEQRTIMTTARGVCYLTVYLAGYQHHDLHAARGRLY